MSAYLLDLRHKILITWQNKENTQRGLAKRLALVVKEVMNSYKAYPESIYGD
jgi:hypothetical protein